MIIAIDVKTAFNETSHQIIVEECKRYYFSNYLIYLISCYLKDIILQIEKIEVTSGVPQESLLGPSLWYLLYDVVSNTLLESNMLTI